MPALQEIISQVFPNIPIMKTLSDSESIARGCAMQAAMLSPLFKVKEYEMKEYNYYPILCKWSFISEMEEEPKKEVVLLPAGCAVPVIKSLTFPQRKEPIELSLFYNDPVPFNAEKLIAKYLVTPQPVEEK